MHIHSTYTVKPVILDPGNCRYMYLHIVDVCLRFSVYKFTETTLKLAQYSSDLLKMVDVGDPRPRLLLGMTVTENVSLEETSCNINMVVVTISSTTTATSAELTVIR